MVLASVAMGVALWFLQDALAVQLGGDTYVQILALAGLVVGGLATYAIAVLITGAIKRQDLKRLRNH
jgi:hypothetical protein